MSCDRIRERLDAMLDGELAPAERASIESHLRDCGSCARASTARAEAIRALRETALLRTPPSFERAVLSRVRAERARRRRVGRLVAAGIAASLAAAAGIRIALLDGDPATLRDAGPAPSVATAARPEMAPDPRVPEGAPEASEAAEPDRAPSVTRVPLDLGALAWQGTMLLGAVAGFVARANASLPPIDEPAAPTAAESGTAPVEARVARADATDDSPAAPPDVSDGARAEEGVEPAVPAPIDENARLVRKGNEVVLYTDGPADREIPALLGFLRDEGGEGADLARSRLETLADELAEHGVRKVEAADDSSPPFDKLRRLFGPRETPDPRAVSVERWERWWETNRTSIARVAHAGR